MLGAERILIVNCQNASRTSPVSSHKRQLASCCTCCTRTTVGEGMVRREGWVQISFQEVLNGEVERLPI